ncbi:MAG: hypothetical protein V3U11_09535 [Planctomycetota bacterium]
MKECFDAEGVSIPFPQRDIHVYQESDGQDSDKAVVLPRPEATKAKSEPKAGPIDLEQETSDASTTE